MEHDKAYPDALDRILTNQSQGKAAVDWSAVSAAAAANDMATEMEVDGARGAGGAGDEGASEGPMEAATPPPVAYAPSDAEMELLYETTVDRNVVDLLRGREQRAQCAEDFQVRHYRAQGTEGSGTGVFRMLVVGYLSAA